MTRDGIAPMRVVLPAITGAGAILFAAADHFHQPLKPLKKPVTLEQIKANSALANIYLVRQPRFSVMPLTKDEYEEIFSMSK